MKQSFWIVIGIIIVIGFFGMQALESRTGSGNYEDFATCLTESGAKMYGTDWCGHCKSQKKLFGDSFKFVDYTDCDKDREACVNAGVTGYPTWKINGENYPGTQQLFRLASLSGCEL